MGKSRKDGEDETRYMKHPAPCCVRVSIKDQQEGAMRSATTCGVKGACMVKVLSPGCLPEW